MTHDHASPAAPGSLEAVLLAGDARWATGKRINGIAFHPSGARVALVGDGGSAVFDAQGALVWKLGGRWGAGYAFAADWSPDGKLLAVGYHAGHLVLLDAADGAAVRELRGHGGVPDAVRSVAFSPDGARLASASSDGTFRLWDVETGEAIAVWENTGEDRSVHSVAWSPDGARVAVSTEGFLNLFDGRTGALQAGAPAGSLGDVLFLDGGRRYACSAADLVILDADLRPVREVPLPGIGAIRLAADGASILAGVWEGSRYGVVRVELRTYETRWLEGHAEKPVWAVAVQPGTGRIFCGGDLGQARVWEADGTPVEVGMLGHAGEVKAILPDPARDRFFTAGDDGKVLEWSLSRRSPVRALACARPAPVAALALSADGETLYAARREGIAAFSLQTGTARWEVAGDTADCLAVDGEQLVSSSIDRLVRVDATTGKILKRSGRIGHRLFNLVRLADGRWLTTDFYDPRLEVWDAAGKRARALPLPGIDAWDPPPKLYDLAVAAGGARVYGAMHGGAIVSLSGEKLEAEVVHRHQGVSRRIALSPSGDRLALSGASLVVLDTATWKPLARAQVEEDCLLRFVDERRLLCGATTGEVRLLTLPA